jgi:DNA-binding Lrp family transcriptional regulator
MAAINKAIEAAKSQESPNYSEIARTYGVSRSTLSKRVRGIQQSGSEYYQSTRLLSPLQERVLIDHINHLTKIGLPPTPAIVRNFTREISGKELGKM